MGTPRQPSESITAEQVRELLSYDGEKGLFYWRVPRQKRKLDRAIGYSRRSASYIRIGIDGTRYYAHRLAWLYVHGNWPAYDVDHINGDRGDNRLCNLREATMSDNLANRGAQKNNSSGRKGVHRNVSGKWCAQIKVRGRRFHLGLFETVDAAGEAYEAAARKHFGEFAKATKATNATSMEASPWA